MMMILQKEDGSTVATVDNDILLYWRMVDEEMGFMEKIVLPTGGVILFDEEEGKSNFEPLKEYIGATCHYHVDGEYRWTKTLEDVRPTQEGTMALWFKLKLEPLADDADVELQMNAEEVSA